MNWIETTKYLCGEYKKFELKPKIAMFDLDDTLICTLSGKDFSQNAEDWKIKSDKIKPKLKSFVDNGFCIIIISNQKGISKGKVKVNDWQAKIKSIGKNIDVPFRIYASIADDIYRKPYITFWDIIQDEIDVDFDKCFYCGDACGRKGDHADTDLKFALNCKINFYTPEELFNNVKQTIHIPKYSVNFDNVEKNTDEFLFEPNNKDVVIMIGFPASGKSTFAEKNILVHKYELINMDTLKTKAKCHKEFEALLKNNKNVVVDNTNPSKDTRKYYIDTAKKYGYQVRCIEIKCTREIAYHTSHFRAYITDGKTRSIPMVAYHTFAKVYDKPKKNEGFDEIATINFIPPESTSWKKYYF